MYILVRKRTEYKAVYVLESTLISPPQSYVFSKMSSNKCSEIKNKAELITVQSKRIWQLNLKINYFEITLDLHKNYKLVLPSLP